ncbi:MAG: FAD-dependent oxidoreductase [Haloquadratum sp.]
MTLADIERYDPDRVTERGERAIVVGASMAGLQAARVLADAFEAVTVVERDPLPDEPVARRGVPQAEHVHAMLEPGRVVLEDLFPGYGAELRDEGGLRIRGATDLDLYQQGAFLAEGDAPLPFYCASRPLYEQVARRRVAGHEAITLRDTCQFTDYVAGDDAGVVEGVAMRDANGDEETLWGEVVVDATGRTSRTPEWLDSHGYPTPPVDEVAVDLAYSTVVLERPPDTRQGYLVVPSPPTPRGGTAIPIEGDRWIVTLFGLHGEHPPTDESGFRAFAASLPTPVLAELLDDHEWLSEEVRHYPFPASTRRRYEELDRVPEGLLVTGDALASFNPIYGQGMSVAALDALALHHTLADGIDDLATRFFDRAAAAIDDAWQIAVGADFEFPETTGPKPRGADLFNRYLSAVVRTSHTDGHVAEAFTRVLRLEVPPTRLLRPDVVRRVVAAEVRRYV